MTTYAEKVEFLVSQTAILRNVLAKKVEMGKMTHEVAQKNIDIMESILADYSRKKLITLAGVLANDTWFKTYVGYEKRLGREATNMEAASYIREYCGIVSRRDLAFNKEARIKFDEMRQRFSDFRKYRETEK